MTTASAWSDHALDDLRAAGFRSGGARRAVVELPRQPGLLPFGAGDPRRRARRRRAASASRASTGRSTSCSSCGSSSGSTSATASRATSRAHADGRPSPPPRLRRLRQASSRSATRRSSARSSRGRQARLRDGRARGRPARRLRRLPLLGRGISSPRRASEVARARCPTGRRARRHRGTREPSCAGAPRARRWRARR